MNRRSFIVAAGLLAAGPAAAEDWRPQRPMRIVVPFAPGGTADTIARLIADPTAAILGQPVLIENRPGGNGTVAAISVARGPADGLTLLYCSPSIQILNPLMMRNIPYDAMADFAPVIALMRAPKILVVRPDFPARDVAELIALARTRREGISFASAGIGSSGHLAGALFGQMAGVELLHVPYRGTAPGVQDLMAGRVDMVLDTAAALLPLVQDGRLRALAVSTQEPSPLAPGLPPIATTLPGFNDASFNYLVAAARTPPEAIAAINAAIGRVLAEPAMRERFASLGAEPLGGSPEQLAVMVQSEITRWRDVITAQRITLE